MSEKISIIVPIYNTSKFLDKCINSILKQTYKGLEIILVNDGSTDDSLKKINDYKKIDNRIIIINKKNGGLSSARNAGIKIATGNYILNVDSDDWLENNTCEILLKTAIKNDADIVIGNIFLEYKNKKEKWEDLKNNKIYNNLDYLYAFFSENGKGSVSNKLIKRELYIDNKIYHPEGISLGEDTSTLLRLALKSKKIVKIGNYIYHYRQNEFSMMYSKNKKIYEYIEAVEIIKKYYFDNNSNNIYEKIEKILKYKLFYKQLFLTNYLITKNSYKNEWKNLKNEINKLEKDTFYIYIPLKEKILLKLYKFNINLTNILLMRYLQYKNIKRK